MTLRPAIAGTDRQELLRRIAQEEPVAPRRLDPAIPRELETIVLKAMAKEPAARYATSRELADDLRRFLEDKPIRAQRLLREHRGARKRGCMPYPFVALSNRPGNFACHAKCGLDRGGTRGNRCNRREVALVYD